MRKTLVFIALAVTSSCGYQEPAEGVACDCAKLATSACGGGVPVSCGRDTPTDTSACHWYRDPGIPCSACTTDADGGLRCR